MKYIKETVIGQVALEELDFVIQDELLGKNPDGHDYNFIGDENFDGYWAEGDYIPTKILQNTIAQLKEKGATHFQIYPHCDHHGYYITGVKLEKLLKKEGESAKNKKLKKEIEQRKNILERNQKLLNEEEVEIEKLNNKLNGID